MKIKLVFLDWNLKGKSVYSTEVGNELSKGPFHSGTTFDGTITLDREDERELRKSILKGYQPCFWIAAFGDEIKLKERGGEKEE